MAHPFAPTAIGTVGVALLLVAFFLNLARRWRTDGWSYGACNLAGAALACWSSWLIGFLPFVVLEAVWAAVAAAALVRKVARGATRSQPTAGR